MIRPKTSCLAVISLVLVVLVVSEPGQAQSSDQELAARLKALEGRVRQLEAELAAVRAAQQTPAPGVTTAGVTTTTAPAPVGLPGAPASQLPVYGGASAAASKIFNPDISLIGDFIGAVGRNPVRPLPTLEMHETELGLQAVIDPFARGDVFLSFGEEGVELEEGYITFTSLPGGLLAKVGKMRSEFGVVNKLHNHNLPWIDRPLVTENLLGGEDGLNDASLSLSRLLPAPQNVFLEATVEVGRGDAADVWESSQRSDVSVLGHLRGYGDLTEETNLDLGFSYGRGHNDFGSSFITDLYGFDATVRWKPLRRAIYRSFLGRTELVWSRRREPLATQSALGLYTSAEYRLSRRWTVGGRFDWSERARDASLTDKGFSAIFTYWPSEFSQLRWQYRFADYAEGQQGNELLFQFLFVLGAHGAHPF
ncbi:MAG: TonB-dependent receptor [Acidobacteria bacterium]|nr:TonB-dependent receptor [Acidobacteriota bacterium]